MPDWAVAMRPHPGKLGLQPRGFPPTCDDAGVQRWALQNPFTSTKVLQRGDDSSNPKNPMRILQPEDIPESSADLQAALRPTQVNSESDVV